MLHHVIVSFGKDRDFEFRLTAEDLAGLTAAQARHWFDREYADLECDVASPTGKVLLADRLLGVAKYSGERRFKEHPEWGGQYARNAAAMMGRDVIRIDVANSTVGY